MQQPRNELINIDGVTYLRHRIFEGTADHHFSSNGNFCYRNADGSLSITSLYEKYKEYHTYKSINTSISTSEFIFISKNIL